MVEDGPLSRGSATRGGA